MADLIDREAAISITDYAVDEHPYKDPGKPKPTARTTKAGMTLAIISGQGWKASRRLRQWKLCGAGTVQKMTCPHVFCATSKTTHRSSSTTTRIFSVALEKGKKMLEFSNQSDRIARKVYTCDLCGEKIYVGEKYSRYAGKYDSMFFDMKHHMLCTEIIRQYCLWADDDEYTEDDVLDWIRETICSDCIHSWYEGGRDDCDTSVFLCPTVINRFVEQEV